MALYSPEWLERANRLALVARQLSSTIHDVNNMLQVISGHAELLPRAPGAGDMVIKRANTIGEQAHRATVLLAELAAFAKDTGDHSERVGLLSIGQRALTMRSQALSKLRVSPVVEGEEITVQGNSRRLLQIALNLVVNAELALARMSGPALRVEVARVGDRGELTVEYNGVSAPSGPGTFVNAPLRDERAADPLGIGLTVSEWLAAEHHGSLEQTALPTGGSRLTLSLPVAPSERV